MYSEVCREIFHQCQAGLNSELRNEQKIAFAAADLFRGPVFDMILPLSKAEKSAL